MKTKFFLLTFILLSIIFLTKVSFVKATACRLQCGSNNCEVCDDKGTRQTSDDECRQCGGGGQTEGQCANNSQCGSQCCNGGQCGACGGGTLTCPAGSSPNGSSTPPYCSPNATPAPPICPLPVVSECFGGCGGPGAGVYFLTYQCPPWSKQLPCNLPACSTAPPSCTYQACPTVCDQPSSSAQNANCTWRTCGATAACAAGSTSVPTAVPTPVPTATSVPSLDWWQVKDGDVTTNGNITSRVPSGSYFNTVGLGGFPGVPVYNGTLTMGSGTVSARLWNSNTTSSLTRLFNYSYFENLVPANVTLNDVSLLASGGVATGGYEWFKTTGDYTVSSDIDFGARKVIIFIKTGNLNINSKINLTDNAGFFGAFVNGSINVGSTVSGTPALETVS